MGEGASHAASTRATKGATAAPEVRLFHFAVPLQGQGDVFASQFTLDAQQADVASHITWPPATGALPKHVQAM
jgi:hypothetical protein